MKKLTMLAAWLAVGLAMTAAQAVTSGEAAPAFEAQDSEGQPHKLSDYAGKHVVLEWTNPGCPFVQKHYTSGNMQRLQKQWREKGVVWLTVATGKTTQNAAALNDFKTKQGMASSALLLDADGTVGRAYGAKTTPHLFVIDGAGKLVYQGAIDDKNGTDPAETAEAKNLVSAALTESLAGQPVSTAQTQPYGCGVKY